MPGRCASAAFRDNKMVNRLNKLRHIVACYGVARGNNQSDFNLEALPSTSN